VIQENDSQEAGWPWDEQDLREYNSKTSRLLEAAMSFRLDLKHTLWWCDHLQSFGLADPGTGESGWNNSIVRGLWDAVLVALFRHYKQNPVPELRRLYDDVLEGLDQGHVGLFEALEKERDKRVAHPIGFKEAHLIGVAIEEEGPKLHTWSLAFAGPTVREVAGLRAIAEALLAANDELRRRVKRELLKELGSLSQEDLERLPLATFRQHGRRFGL
jgi:hypothetical protein